MVRLEERPWRSSATLLLDTRARAHLLGPRPATPPPAADPQDSLEWLVEAAASIGSALAGRGAALRVLTDAGELAPADGRRGLGRRRAARPPRRAAALPRRPTSPRPRTCCPGRRRRPRGGAARRRRRRRRRPAGTGPVGPGRGPGRARRRRRVRRPPRRPRSRRPATEAARSALGRQQEEAAAFLRDAGWRVVGGVGPASRSRTSGPRCCAPTAARACRRERAGGAGRRVARQDAGTTWPPRWPRCSGAAALSPVFSAADWVPGVLAAVTAVAVTGLLLRAAGPALWAAATGGRAPSPRLVGAGRPAGAAGAARRAGLRADRAVRPGARAARLVPTPASLADLGGVLVDGSDQIREQFTPAEPLTGLCALTALMVGDPGRGRGPRRRRRPAAGAGRARAAGRVLRAGQHHRRRHRPGAGRAAGRRAGAAAVGRPAPAAGLGPAAGRRAAAGHRRPHRRPHRAARARRRAGPRVDACPRWPRASWPTAGGPGRGDGRQLDRHRRWTRPPRCRAS